MSSNEYMRVYMLNRYHARRAEAIEHLGGKCIRCGADERLELDHITPADKTYDIAKVWSYSVDKFWAEVNKCQLLCHRCHKKKTRADRPEQPHGTYWRYHKYECRCDECKTAYSAYRKKYR